MTAYNSPCLGESRRRPLAKRPMIIAAMRTSGKASQSRVVASYPSSVMHVYFDRTFFFFARRSRFGFSLVSLLAESGSEVEGDKGKSAKSYWQR